MTNLYVCKVEFIQGGEEQKEYCLCNAETYAECTLELEDSYGKENIISMKMFALEEGPIVITKNLAKRIVNAEWGEPIN